jgi:CheY-like chemotaxis protein
LPVELPKEKDVVDHSLDDSMRDDGGLHALVAEDNKVNQKLLANMLKRMGHTSDVAVNGKIAIDLLERSEFDVVLMDIQMPVMDGLEATRRIRSMGYSTLPILGLTASVARSDFTELGFSDWLPKPIPMRELKSKLHRIKGQMRHAALIETAEKQ